MEPKKTGATKKREKEREREKKTVNKLEKTQYLLLTKKVLKILCFFGFVTSG